MFVFRMLLIFFAVCIWVYTVLVMSQHGMNFVPVLVENVRALAWSGQFNVDFGTYLILSGVWVAWRDKFSLKGIIWGLIASVAGMFFFAPYLFMLTLNTKGDINEVLLGSRKT